MLEGKHSLRDLGKAFKVPHSTLYAALKRIGKPTGKQAKCTVSQAYEALTQKADSKGTLQEERLLKLRAERKLMEQELAKNEQELIPAQEASDLATRCLVPVRQRLNSLPTEAATRVNPGDPKLAEAALRKWVDDSLAMIREGLPQLERE